MTNLEVVQRLYDAFGRRDREAILAVLHPQVEWVQNEGFPNGGTHVGSEAVLDNVFARFRRDWDSWQAVVTEWLDAGEAIVALGEYRGTFQETRRSTRAAFAHVYRVRDGRVIKFQQFTDTLKVAEAMRLPGE